MVRYSRVKGNPIYSDYGEYAAAVRRKTDLGYYNPASYYKRDVKPKRSVRFSPRIVQHIVNGRAVNPYRKGKPKPVKKVINPYRKKSKPKALWEYNRHYTRPVNPYRKPRYERRMSTLSQASSTSGHGVFYDVEVDGPQLCYRDAIGRNDARSQLSYSQRSRSNIVPSYSSPAEYLQAQNRGPEERRRRYNLTSPLTDVDQSMFTFYVIDVNLEHLRHEEYEYDNGVDATGYNKKYNINTRMTIGSKTKYGRKSAGAQIKIETSRLFYREGRAIEDYINDKCKGLTVNKRGVIIKSNKKLIERENPANTKDPWLYRFEEIGEGTYKISIAIVH